ncbi:MAG: ABC transporter ATP-binding protein [Lachnospiraceae bacterium]|nr:ABC transporter ATP-binding protein [Lachnospiraceae bacterium]
MKLYYELKEEQKRLVQSDPSEELWYCVPLDLLYDRKNKVAEEKFAGKEQFIAVTTKRILVLNGNEISYERNLADCEEVKCETMVGCGIVTAKVNGAAELVARFSMRHIERVAYVARGADLLAKGDTEKITSHEYEKYCEKCGRALPGTSKCPKCDGKNVVIKKFTDLCGGYQWKLLGISAIMLLSSAISILMPYVQKNFIDNVLATKSGDMTDVAKFVGIMLALTAVNVTLYILKNWWCVLLGSQLSMDLRRKLYTKIQRLSMSFMNKRKPGELMNRVSGDTSQIRRFMEEVFGGMLSALITMIASLIIMISIDAKMTLYSTSLIVLVFVITRLYWSYIHKIFHRQWVKDDKLRSGLQDVISGMRVVKSFGQEEAEVTKFKALTADFAQVQKKNETFWALFYPMLTFIMGVGSYIAIYFGGVDVLEGGMTVGTLMQFVTYTGYLYGPLGWMTHLPRSVMQMITSLNRIYDVLDEEPAIKDGVEAKDVEIQGDVTFKDVTFGYNSYDPVLEHIDLEVKKGEMIGLVGASGTGKSTMINLIMRLYDVDRGAILVDGVDVREIKQESFHDQIGVVLQETFLFSGTILNNIRFANPKATMEEVIRAAKAANAHDFIVKTPDGYNTYVGERGFNLSGGERQRIAIARAILTNPRLLILDEATSALDTESEYLIQQALDRLTEGRTTFAIAHRLSTLRNADRLVVIDGHSIAEVGTHDELMEKKGIYHGLVTAQLQMAKL